MVVAGFFTHGSPLPAGPAYLRDLVSDLDLVPPKTKRDFRNREAAQEHVAQLLQLRIRPFVAGAHAWWFLSLGPLRMDDKCADHPEKRFSLGTLRPAKKLVDFYNGHPTARRGVRLMPNERPTRLGILDKEPGVPVRALVKVCAPNRNRLAGRVR